MSVASRNTVTSHGPEEGMKGRRLLREEVPGRVMGCSPLGNLTVRARLDRMDQVRELDCILDEENRNVVANNVKVPLICVAV